MTNQPTIISFIFSTLLSIGTSSQKSTKLVYGGGEISPHGHFGTGLRIYICYYWTGSKLYDILVGKVNMES